MRLSKAFFIAVASFGVFTCQRAPNAKVNVVAADSAHLSAQVTKLASKATTENKRVLVYFHASWCEPCHLVEQAFKRPEAQRALASYYLVEVNVDELPSANALGLAIDFIPLLARVDQNGRVVDTLDGQAFGADPGPKDVASALVRFLAS